MTNLGDSLVILQNFGSRFFVHPRDFELIVNVSWGQVFVLRLVGPPFRTAHSKLTVENSASMHRSRWFM